MVSTEEGSFGSVVVRGTGLLRLTPPADSIVLTLGAIEAGSRTGIRVAIESTCRRAARTVPGWKSLPQRALHIDQVRFSYRQTGNLGPHPHPDVNPPTGGPDCRIRRFRADAPGSTAASCDARAGDRYAACAGAEAHATASAARYVLHRGSRRPGRRPWLRSEKQRIQGRFPSAGPCVDLALLAVVVIILLRPSRLFVVRQTR